MKKLFYLLCFGLFFVAFSASAQTTPDPDAQQNTINMKNYLTSPEGFSQVIKNLHADVVQEANANYGTLTNAQKTALVNFAAQKAAVNSGKKSATFRTAFLAWVQTNMTTATYNAVNTLGTFSHQ